MPIRLMGLVDLGGVNKWDGEAHKLKESDEHDLAPGGENPEADFGGDVDQAEQNVNAIVMKINQMAGDIYNAMGDHDDPEPWVKEKLTKVMQMMNSIHGQVMYDKEKPEELPNRPVNTPPTDNSMDNRPPQHESVVNESIDRSYMTKNLADRMLSEGILDEDDISRLSIVKKKLAIEEDVNELSQDTYKSYRNAARKDQNARRDRVKHAQDVEDAARQVKTWAKEKGDDKRVKKYGSLEKKAKASADSERIPGRKRHLAMQRADRLRRKKRYGTTETVSNEALSDKPADIKKRHARAKKKIDNLSREKSIGGGKESELHKAIEKQGEEWGKLGNALPKKGK